MPDQVIAIRTHGNQPVKIDRHFAAAGVGRRLADRVGIELPHLGNCRSEAVALGAAVVGSAVGWPPSEVAVTSPDPVDSGVGVRGLRVGAFVGVSVAVAVGVALAVAVGVLVAVTVAVGVVVAVAVSVGAAVGVGLAVGVQALASAMSRNPAISCIRGIFVSTLSLFLCSIQSSKTSRREYSNILEAGLSRPGWVDVGYFANACRSTSSDCSITRFSVVMPDFRLVSLKHNAQPSAGVVSLVKCSGSTP